MFSFAFYFHDKMWQKRKETHKVKDFFKTHAERFVLDPSAAVSE